VGSYVRFPFFENAGDSQFSSGNGESIAKTDRSVVESITAAFVSINNLFERSEIEQYVVGLSFDELVLFFDARLKNDNTVNEASNG
jgi:hypothetical protein